MLRNNLKIVTAITVKRFWVVCLPGIVPIRFPDLTETPNPEKISRASEIFSFFYVVHKNVFSSNSYILIHFNVCKDKCQLILYFTAIFLLP